MVQEDTRWKQRFEHFSLAFEQLKAAVELSKQRPLSLLEEQGTIQLFETAVAKEIVASIQGRYFGAFQGLFLKFQDLVQSDKT